MYSPRSYFGIWNSPLSKYFIKISSYSLKNLLFTHTFYHVYSLKNLLFAHNLQPKIWYFEQCEITTNRRVWSGIIFDPLQVDSQLFLNINVPHWLNYLKICFCFFCLLAFINVYSPLWSWYITFFFLG